MSAMGALLFVISFIILIRYIDVIRNRWAAWVREPVSVLPFRAEESALTIPLRKERLRFFHLHQ